jgi:hypothetical protein
MRDTLVADDPRQVEYARTQKIRKAWLQATKDSRWPFNAVEGNRVTVGCIDSSGMRGSKGYATCGGMNCRNEPCCMRSPLNCVQTDTFTFTLVMTRFAYRVECEGRLVEAGQLTPL